MKIHFQIVMFYVSLVSGVFAQKKDSVHIKQINGDVLTGNAKKNIYNTYNTTKIIYRTISKANEKMILDTKEWLDSSKVISINMGSSNSGMSFPFSALKDGHEISPFKNQIQFNDPIDVITLKVIKGNLKISLDVYGYDGTLRAKVRENILQNVQGKTFKPYYGKNFFEVLESDYNIPVLQLELKPNNIIQISGAFCYPRGCLIIFDNGMYIPYQFSRPIINAPDSIKEKLREEYVSVCKKYLKPIHEDE